jgi:hypothetical protein
MSPTYYSAIYIDDYSLYYEQLDDYKIIINN